MFRRGARVPLAVVACLLALTSCSAASSRHVDAPAAAGAGGEAAGARSAGGGAAAAPDGSGAADTPPDQLAFAGGGTPEQGPASTIGATTTSRYANPSADPLVESVTQELAAAQSAAPLTLTTPQARCVATGMLTRLGPDVLARLGASPGASTGQLDLGALDPGQREAFADAVIACIDLDATIVAQVGGSLGLSNDAVDCLARRVDQDGTLTSVVRQALVSGTDLTSSEDVLTGPMLRALTTCLSPDALAKLGKPR